MGDLFQPAHLLVLMFVFSLFFVLPLIFYILTLQNALRKCAPQAVTIDPTMIWLLLVPFVGLVWHFFVVSGMSTSLSNEFARRNIPGIEPEPGKSIGIAMCVCHACNIVPGIGFLTAIPSLILWVIYWAKISEFSRRLDFPLPYPPPGIA